MTYPTPALGTGQANTEIEAQNGIAIPLGSDCCLVPASWFLFVQNKQATFFQCSRRQLIPVSTLVGFLFLCHVQTRCPSTRHAPRPSRTPETSVRFLRTPSELACSGYSYNNNNAFPPQDPCSLHDAHVSPPAAARSADKFAHHTAAWAPLYLTTRVLTYFLTYLPTFLPTGSAGLCQQQQVATGLSSAPVSAPGCAPVVSTTDICSTCVTAACVVPATVTAGCGCPDPPATVFRSHPCDLGCEGLGGCRTVYTVVRADGDGECEFAFSFIFYFYFISSWLSDLSTCRWHRPFREWPWPDPNPERARRAARRAVADNDVRHDCEYERGGPGRTVPVAAVVTSGVGCGKKEIESETLTDGDWKILVGPWEMGSEEGPAMDGNGGGFRASTNVKAFTKEGNDACILGA